MIRQDLIFTLMAMAEVQKYADQMNLRIKKTCEKFEELETRGGSERELGKLKKTVKKFKSQIPSKFRIHYADSEQRPNPWLDGSINRSSNQIHANNKADDHDNISQSLREGPKFEQTTAFEQFKISFLGLNSTLRVCLLCFLRFPEMVAIKKKLMIHWWIGEELLSPIPMDQKTGLLLRKTAEDLGNEFMDELIAKGFIEPIYKNCSLVVDCCRMWPHILSALTIVAERFVFRPICPPSFAQYYENRCLLNISEAIIDDMLEKFSEVNRLKILYLGRWQSSATHHIEVADNKILHGLKNMNQLRFLSLRGISMITMLPSFILQLTNLKILDLIACHNLEVVPDGIGLLKSMTHLDMSECYFLDHMPKTLGSLLQLEVLKGFVIGQSTDKKSCTIHDLIKLSKIRKLSIYTSSKEFPTNKQVCGLQRLKALQKLKISWSGCISQGETDDTPMQVRAQVQGHTTNLRRLPTSYWSDDPKFPCSMQKLVLECFPMMIISSSLLPANLKQLYIRGGQLSDLGPIASTTVNKLRLKYLSKLEMHWTEFRTLFPNLIYLEKVECPTLANFPCDENGVWMNNSQGFM
ncbi:disease resistance RPP13-like protein 4 [Camellia sinensis]|uniref:disease resistance RPP13-like protein 4 n=1 Tax=Camellia sinensis TaxID=4442 RepID=UPI00103633A5|nr:disease resistance RPP13-like protein 4 [Camellia sinensis]